MAGGGASGGPGLQPPRTIHVEPKRAAFHGLNLSFAAQPARTVSGYATAITCRFCGLPAAG